MKKMLLTIRIATVVSLIAFLGFGTATANNIAVTNVSLSNQDTANGSV